jgi:hypothetical protein
MPKKKDDFKATIVSGLERKKQELLTTLDHLMKSRREYEGQLTAGDFIEEADGAQREISAHSQFSLIERKNKELQRSRISASAKSAVFRSRRNAFS